MRESLKDIAYQANAISSKLGCQYGDVRAEQIQKKGALVENGVIENVIQKEEIGIGIRILVNGRWGFCSVSNPTLETIREKLEEKIFFLKKHDLKKKIKLYEINPYKDKVVFPAKKEVSIEEMVKIAKRFDAEMAEKKNITRTNVGLYQNKIQKVFLNTEGAEISQEFTDTVVNMTSTARDNGVTQSVNTTEGGRGGVEIIENQAIKRADEISLASSKLTSASSPENEKTTVVMNPDFVALLTHEILGHPSEGDRVLGREMAWAGGAWWKEKIGQKIGSENLSVIDDPTIENSLGWYKYDDEGIRASSTEIIKEGMLVSHFQNRETAEIFGSNPTANMRATSFRFMPLLRMACTCIDKGDWAPEEIISDTRNGYFICDMKVPSIDMQRYNWNISCQYAYKITNGELGEMVKDVILTGNSPEFLPSIDACGNDFTVRPITNCGKGDPMQVMAMGNGGPTVRGTAKVVSTGNEL